MEESWQELQGIKPGFHSNAMRLRCVNENRKKRKRLRWQAANHGCHCIDRAFLLAGACVCCVKISFTQRTQRKRLRLNGNRASDSGTCRFKTGLTAAVHSGTIIGIG